MAKRKLQVVKKTPPRPDYSGRTTDDLLWEALGLHYYGWKEDAKDILLYLAEQVKDDDVEENESHPSAHASAAPRDTGGQAWWKWN